MAEGRTKTPEESIASFIFSGMSGSALADVGGLGNVEIKAMRDEGYDDATIFGITAASATMGPIVPPSIPFVIYGSAASVSVGTLFLAGIGPGITIGIILCIRKRRLRNSGRVSSMHSWRC